MKFKYLLSLLFAFLGLQAATQTYAALAQYHPALGPHLSGIYPPWAVLGWARLWAAEAPVALGLSVIAGLVIFSFLLTALLLRRPEVISDLHGTASWARRADLEAAGLLENDPNGVSVGGWLNERGKLTYLSHSGPEHVIVWGPTRSGKGVSTIVPTLLSWQDSVVVYDVKGELWALTAGWRSEQTRSDMFRFAPAEEGSSKWNPLAEIRAGDHALGDARNIALMLVDQGDGLKDHWERSAVDFLTGVILFVHAKGPSTLQQVDIEMVRSAGLIDDMAASKNGLISAFGLDMKAKAERERSGVISTAKAFTTLFRSPLVAAATGASDFKIADLMTSDRPVSIYIQIPDAEEARLRPLVRIFLTEIMRRAAPQLEFSGGQQKTSYRHRLLLVLDEFPSLRRLPIFEDAMAKCGGLGIKCFLCCQSIGQLRQHYGVNESITENAHIQAIFTPNKLDTAEYFSKLCGAETVLKKGVTRRGYGLIPDSSRKIEEHRRDLLTPDQILRLPGPKKAGDRIVEPGDMLIACSGRPVIYGRQTPYFLQPEMAKRAAIPPPKSK